MGRKPCCEKVGIKRGPWSVEEDNKLINFILTNGQCCWRALPKLAGLVRCGKSCRLRWTNYLRPDLKRGLLSEDEENIVIDLHATLGNKWSKIVSHLPGRTDNEIKNHWNTHIKKKLKKMGIDPATHKPLSAAPEPPQNQEVEEEEEEEEEDEEKETGNLTMQSSIMTESSKEVNDKRDMISSSTTFFEFDTLMEQLNDNNNGFCIDEVPLIQSHEIGIQLPPTAQPTSAAFSPSCSSTSSSSFDNKNGTSTSSLYNNKDIVDKGIHQDFQNFDWQQIEDYINMSGLWDDDDLINLDHSYLSTIDNNYISGYYHNPGMV